MDDDAPSSARRALEDRSNWEYEALAFDIALLLMTTAAVSRAFRTRMWGCCVWRRCCKRRETGESSVRWCGECGSEMDSEKFDSSLSRTCSLGSAEFSRTQVTIRGPLARWLTGIKIGLSWLLVICPIVALGADYSHWWLHYLDQGIQIFLLVVHAVCATVLAFRGCGEGFWLRLTWTLSLAACVPRLVSAVAQGSVGESVPIWLLASFAAAYAAATSVPLTGIVRAVVPKGGHVLEEVGRGDPIGWFQSRARAGMSVQTPLLFSQEGSGRGTAARLPPLEGDITPIRSLYALRFGTGILRTLSFVLIALKINDQHSQWTWLQVLAPFAASSVTSLGEVLGALASLRSHDASRIDALAHLAGGSVAASVSAGGIGAAMTALLAGMNEDGTLDLRPWEVAVPYVVQTGVVGLCVIAGAGYIVRAERLSRFRAVGLLSAAIFVAALLLAGGITPWTISETSSTIAALSPLLLTAVVAVAAFLLLSEVLVPLSPGKWRALRIDAIIPLGFLISGIILAVDKTVDGWLIVGPALAVQSIVTLHDLFAVLLLQFAACGLLGRPDIARGETQVALARALGEELDAAAVFAVNRMTGDAVSAFARSGSGDHSDGAVHRAGGIAARLAAMELGEVRPGEEEAVVVIHSDGQSPAELFGLEEEEAQRRVGREATGVTGGGATGGRDRMESSATSSVGFRDDASEPSRRASAVSVPTGTSFAAAVSGAGLKSTNPGAILRAAAAAGTRFSDYSALETAAWIDTEAGLPRYAGTAFGLLSSICKGPQVPGAAGVLLSALRGQGPFAPKPGDVAGGRRALVDRLGVSNARHKRRLLSALAAHLPRVKQSSAPDATPKTSEAGGSDQQPVSADDDGFLDAAIDALGSVGAAEELWGPEGAEAGAAAAAAAAGGGAAPTSKAGEDQLSPEERDRQRREARRDRLRAALSRSRALPREWIYDTWLPQIGLPQFCDAAEAASFIPEDIVTGTLVRDESLKALNMNEPLFRDSLRAAIRFLLRCGMDVDGEVAELRRERWVPRPELPDHLPAWTNADVVRWLIRVLPLDPERHGGRINRLRKSGLHGALLFTKRPFEPNYILAAFGLTPETATKALKTRIEEALHQLQELGAARVLDKARTADDSASGDDRRLSFASSTFAASEVGIGVESVVMGKE